MKLNAWLRQNPASSARLQVIERLAQEITAAHERGEPMSALDPEHVEVENGAGCDISAARRGTPAPGYGAPERAEGGPPSPEADIYAAGAIAWEILAGRPYAPAPSHLAEAARDVPRELADAIMACLEQSPQWRPRDLSYIAQLAQQTLGKSAPAPSARPASSKSTRAVRPSSGRQSRPTSTSVRAASPLRTTPLHESRSSHLMLAVIAGGVVLAAGAGYFWLTRGKTEAAATTTPATVAPAALTVTARPEVKPPVTQVAAALPPPTAAAAMPVASALTAAPVTMPSSTQPAAPVTRALPPVTLAPPPPRVQQPPQPTPVPVTMARVAPPTLAAQPYAPVDPPRQAAPAATMAAAPPPTLPPATMPAAIPSAPPVLSAVSPLSVRRPGKVVLDLRGSGLRKELRALVIPVKEAPHGITVVKGVCKSPDLFQVLVDLDAGVAPGAYAIALADANGQTKALTFTVTK